jgi:two-component system nitrate/nitrite response regulator NarL
MPAIATALVGPNALVREGLASILANAGFRVLASAFCTDDLGLSAGSKPRTSLLIIDAADELKAAVRQIELFKNWCPGGRVAVLGDPYYPSDIDCVFRAGANAYLAKETRGDALIKYLELVMLGGTILPVATLSTVIERGTVVRDENSVQEPKAITIEDRGTPQLSDKEKRILNCLCSGESNKTIARRMDIAEATVKVHVKALLRKIRVQNRTQAAIWAMSNGLSVVAVSNLSAHGFR